MSNKPANGFTLLEVMVALAVFSLAALALLRLQGASLATTARLDEKLGAAIVVANLAIEARLALPAPAFGATAGSVQEGDRPWSWQQQVLRTPDPSLQRIEIAVSGADGSVLARQTVVRPAQ